MTASMINHCGAVEISRTDLALIEPPTPTATWYPTKHSDVLDSTLITLDRAGYGVTDMKLATNKDHAHFFALLTLDRMITDGVGLSAIIRNATDKSISQKFGMGQRVFICDNLAFNAEIEVGKKHTRFVMQRFNEAIAHAVNRLADYRQREQQRVEYMQGTAINDTEANDLILRAYFAGAILKKNLEAVHAEWHKPTHEQFSDRNKWSLFNAFTEVIKPRFARMPQRAAVETQKLSRLMVPDDVIDAEAVTVA